jgi:formate C-acetyltransferase
MANETGSAVAIPGADVELDLTLATEIANLRDVALELHSSGTHSVPTLALIDAHAWAERTDDEDWLFWRARRTAARLGAMAIALSPGERIVGRPDLRAPSRQEAREIAAVQDVIESIPPFPGGDTGHFHPDFDKLFAVGIGGIRREIQSRVDSSTEERAIFFIACDVAIEGMSHYIGRVATECELTAAAADECSLAYAGNGDEGSQALRELTRICRHISTEPPATFHEAIQLMFLTVVALWFGEDHALTTPGRMDQTLRPFYEADIAAGRLTREEALELICCFYIQLNMILGAGSALSVMIGGRDRNGVDVTSELTFLCLAARQATRLAYPTVGLAWHEGTPAELTDFACRMLRGGTGDPAFFNDELIASGLRDLGVSEFDSYNYMNSTCVEIKVVGASHIWATAPYFNCGQVLLDVVDLVADGNVEEPAGFDEFSSLLSESFATAVRESAERLDAIWRQRAQTGCFPLGSCLIADCLERGVDFDRGGARYNWVENSFVGLANLTDSLIAIKHLVYDIRELTLSELRDILRDDFEGAEPLRQRILNRLPSYGNTDDEADAMAVTWAEILQEVTAENSVGGHTYVPGFFCWVMHGRLGADTGATPDGRKAGVTLADGAGAAQGREQRGPTPSLLSTTKWSHQGAIGGFVHNVVFSKSALDTDAGLQTLRGLIETNMRRRGFEIHVNVVSADTLRDAQAHPEDYADLLVRVAGYSDYFVHLDPNMQAEVIARTEHKSL